MRILVDCGNTLIKWALVRDKVWLDSGVLPTERAGELYRDIGLHLGALGLVMNDFQQIWISNVAGTEVMQVLTGAQLPVGAFFRIAEAKQQQCGVKNGYAEFSQLGSDRWAALIASWDIMRGQCMVVNCGTATTIDTLSDNGEYTGGLILPGLDLMQKCLNSISGRLISKQGKFEAFPKNTADAIVSGSIQASCGAIKRQYALLGKDNVPLVLSGGASGTLERHLDMPLLTVDNLVLHGLMIISLEANNQ